MDVQQPTASCAHHRGHSSKTAEQRKLIPAPFTWLGEVAGPRRALNASMSRPRRPEYANSDRTQCQILFPEALQRAQGVVEFPLPKRETTYPPRWWRW